MGKKKQVDVPGEGREPFENWPATQVNPPPLKS